MSVIGKHGVNTTTPDNILLGAGTIHKNLVWGYTLTTDTAIVTGKTYYTRSGTAPNYTYTVVSNPSASSLSTYYEAGWTGDIIGATSGGNSVEIKGEVKDIELDGALVKVKGLAVMQGGTATMEVNFAELSMDVMKMGMIAATGTSDATGYDMIQTKANIESGDYVANFGFVGKTANDAKTIIVIMENALCTSGLKIEGKNKENSVISLTMESYANNAGNLDKVPVRIYYPTETN